MCSEYTAGSQGFLRNVLMRYFKRIAASAAPTTFALIDKRERAHSLNCCISRAAFPRRTHANSSYVQSRRFVLQFTPPSRKNTPVLPLTNDYVLTTKIHASLTST